MSGRQNVRFYQITFCRVTLCQIRNYWHFVIGRFVRFYPWWPFVKLTFWNFPRKSIYLKIILDEEKTKNEEESKQNVCTSSQILKLFRLAQFQIEYLLKSQQEMVVKVEKMEKLAKRYKKENKIIKEQFCYGPNNNENEVEENEKKNNKRK